jgi:hypothetical protein
VASPIEIRAKRAWADLAKQHQSMTTSERPPANHNGGVMTLHDEPSNPDSGERGLRHKDKAEPKPRSRDDSEGSPTGSSSHHGAVGGALIGGAVGGVPGLVGGALLGSVLDEEDSE